MLILTRKIGERILIGDRIEIVVSSCSKGAARIGITAPRDIKIMRSELTESQPQEQGGEK